MAFLRRLLAAMIALALSCGVSRACESGAFVADLRVDRLEAKLALIAPEAAGHDVAPDARAGTSNLGPAAGVDAARGMNFGVRALAMPVQPERAVMPAHPPWIATVELRL